VIFFAVEDDPMAYDNQAVQRYLYGDIDRMRANIAVSEAAYAEAIKRMDSSAPRRLTLAQAVKQRQKLQRVELDWIDPLNDPNRNF
jgi:hypothetical protein